MFSPGIRISLNSLALKIGVPTFKRPHIPNLLGHPAGQDPAHEADENTNEDRHADQPRDDDVDRIELVHVAFKVFRLAHAEERPRHRTHGLQERRLARHRVFERMLFSHDFGSVVLTAACGAAGILPPTSKKVYDKVMVVTSFGIFGSITNTTGQCLLSPDFSVYSLKQKHSSLLKYGAACLGA